MQPGGRCYGTVQVESADVHGTLQGEVFVKQLITIRTADRVNGNVQYGRLAMEMGANLSAEVRNVPPTLAGDLDLTVDKGKSVRITLQDLTALDPDDDAQHLTFTVSRAKNGFVTMIDRSRAPGGRRSRRPTSSAATVLFRHDGTNGRTQASTSSSPTSGAYLGRGADRQRRRCAPSANRLSLSVLPKRWRSAVLAFSSAARSAAERLRPARLM